MPTYWGNKFQLIQQIQTTKREEFGLAGNEAVRSDMYVMINPMTHQEVPLADLQYAKEHFWELVESGAIRNERWAFLWYH